MSSSLRIATSALRPSARSLSRCASVGSAVRHHSTTRVPEHNNNNNNNNSFTATTASWARTVRETMAELNEVLSGRLEPLDSSLDLQKGGPGTKSSPTPVPSVSEERVVGCACGDDHSGVQWILLKHGKVEECGNCGNFFELVLQDDAECGSSTTSSNTTWSCKITNVFTIVKVAGLKFFLKMH